MWRPPLGWHDKLRENGGALDGVQPLSAKGKNFLFTSSRANDVYRRRWRTAASHEAGQFPADDKGKGKEIYLLAALNV